jgi:UDP-3-O-[3-hydroxymyristoyl] glucosamine N-acyltransferase
MNKKNFTLRELAILTASTLVGDPDVAISNVETLELATPQDASFLASPRYEQAMLRSRAAVVFVARNVPLPPNRNFLLCDNPSAAFQACIEAFFDDSPEISGFCGIHPTAVIHPSVILKENVQIGPYVVIDKGCTIDCNTVIGAGTIIGPHVSIGKECLLHPRTTVCARTTIGDRVILQSGCVIGSCGFGYLTDGEGKHTKLSQKGNVTIGDDVEIGANTTIDRARFKTTHIQNGTKIDNLVQIGHGVTVGKHNIIVAQTGIAGSTEMGDHVTLAGQVAIAGHLKITKGTMVAACSGVSKSITKPGKYGGLPAMPLDEYNRSAVYMRKIETYAEKIKLLEARVEALSKN